MKKSALFCALIFALVHCTSGTFSGPSVDNGSPDNTSDTSAPPDERDAGADDSKPGDGTDKSPNDTGDNGSDDETESDEPEDGDFQTVCERARKQQQESQDGDDATSRADSDLLNTHGNARAAYSLRKLRSGFSGPVVKIRRGSDNKTKEIGFNEKGWIDVKQVESFVGQSDGYVVAWYGQVEGTPSLSQESQSRQPIIARNGRVLTNAEQRPTLKFEPSRYLESGTFDDSISLTDYTLWGVVHPTEINGETDVFGIGTLGNKSWQTASYRLWQSYINHAGSRFGDASGSVNNGEYNVIFMRNSGQTADIWQGNTKHATTTDENDENLSKSRAKSRVSVGSGFTGTLSEFVVYPHVPKDKLYKFYASVARDWHVGPAEWNQGAILPQQYDYQVTLYDWLDSLSLDDVRLPDGRLNWDASQLSDDELADLWLKTRHLTASSVTRGNPHWYVLDAGERGIEATGKVRTWYEPEGSGGYGGNPPRSWANEPAYLYQLDLPAADGGQGNPYYHDPAVGRRALVAASVDLMMHHANWKRGSSGWYDMFGKAALSWAETYRFTKGTDLLSDEVQKAFETGLEYVLDRMISRHPRGVNTNMDTFAIQAQAEIAMATDDPGLECKALQATRKALFGHTDGKLGEKHDVFPIGDRDGGIFDPSGFIMEGGQPDIFYGGESIFHIAGALAAVTDRETGEIPREWRFLEEVVRRLQAWRTYQMFYDPKANSPAVGGKNERNVWTAGAGLSGRTSYGVPHGQAGEVWKHTFIGAQYEDFSYKASVPSVSDMKDDIDSSVDHVSEQLESNYEGTPDEWSGWSPWAKKTPYLPEKGWYSKLRQLEKSNDPKFENPPIARDGVSYNKSFGGKPVGKQYWAYKDTDGPQTWGFFLEAQPRQGGYGGWYGGKIETFWTKKTGVILLNRHGKTGCDRSGVDDYSGGEDSTCWFNLERKAGHHVWGRDENGKGFTTLLLRGRNLERSSEFDIQSDTPTVSVTNVFNDPSLSEDSSQTGEQTGSEIEGDLTVENTFKVRDSGLEVTHAVESDGSDEIEMLWASLPVYLRHFNPHRAGDQLHRNIDDTSIEYWTGNSWDSLKVDSNSDGTPDLKETSALRLTRNYEMGDGPQHAYIDFSNSQKVRLSTGNYYDPYQSRSGVRTVHIAIHENPGTITDMPENKSVTYTIRPTSPVQ